MKAIILIGGFGTRLRPLTCNTPKPLLPVLNKPFSLYQIELLKKYGIKDIILCMAYLPSEFKKYFGDGKKFGVKISYAVEKTPLGTGGAIKNAEKFVNDSVLIFNGDVLTEINLAKLIQFHKNKKSKATISLVSVPDPTSYGLVETAKDGKILQFLEKPSTNQITVDTINAGTYIFEPEIFKEMPPDVVYSVERELFPALLNKKIPFYGYIYSAYWIDIGTTEKYLQVHNDLMNRMKKNVIGKNSKIAKSVRIFGHLVVGGGTDCGHGGLRFLIGFHADLVDAVGDILLLGGLQTGGQRIIQNHALLGVCLQFVDQNQLGSGLVGQRIHPGLALFDIAFQRL